ncbi:MAG: hypothetical protein HYV28_00690 [Ignavibacteriales bacterium]|nr:hypothetical protein [Ignavibacteriales bacterium]
MKAIFLLIVFSLCATAQNISTLDSGFSCLAKGELIKAVDEFRKSFRDDAWLPDNSIVVDSVYRFAIGKPENSEVNYVLGVLCAEKHFYPDAYLYLEKYLRESKGGSLRKTAQSMIHTLKVKEKDIPYYRFLSEYLTLVKCKKGNTKRFWDERTVKKLGNEYDLYQQIDYPETFDTLHFTPLQTAIHDSDNTTLKAGPFSYMIISDSTGMKLTQPILYLTRNWYATESEHYIFHYQYPFQQIDPAAIKKFEEFAIEMIQEYKVPMLKKIYYFFSPDPRILGRFYFRPAVRGMASTQWLFVSSISWSNTHEITHCLTHQVMQLCLYGLFSEGLAEYHGGATSFGKDFIYPWVKDLAFLNKEPKVSAIYKDEEFFNRTKFDVNDNIFTAAAFLKFVRESYGKRKFLSLLNESDPEIIPEKFTLLFNKTLPELEREFHTWLIATDFPSINSGFNSNAEQIFNLQDNAYDDNGNGNYQYPIDTLLLPGALDLLKMRVLQDERNNYFELSFRNLCDMDSVEWGFYRTEVNIYIKIDKNTNTAYTWQKAALSGRYKYVLSISDKGISLYSYDDEQTTAMKLYKTGTPLGDTTTKTIRFAVSRKLIPEVNEYSSYFVGVGPSDLGFGFKKSSATFTGRIAELQTAVSKNNGSCADNAGLRTNFFDVLLPPDADQSAIFNSISIKDGSVAVFPYVSTHKQKP